MQFKVHFTKDNKYIDEGSKDKSQWPGFEYYLNVPLEYLLRNVKNGGEIQCLLQVAKLGMELEIVLHEILTMAGYYTRINVLIIDRMSSYGNGNPTSILVLLKQSQQELIQQMLLLWNRLKDLLNELVKSKQVMQRYKESNDTIYKELHAAHCNDLANQKKIIADIENILIDRIGSLHGQLENVKDITHWEKILPVQSQSVIASSNEYFHSDSPPVCSKSQGLENSKSSTESTKSNHDKVDSQVHPAHFGKPNFSNSKKRPASPLENTISKANKQ